MEFHAVAGDNVVVPLDRTALDRWRAWAGQVGVRVIGCSGDHVVSAGVAKRQMRTQ